MSLLDRLLDSAIGIVAAPLFTPDRPIPWARPGLTPATAASVSAADSAFAVQAAETGLGEVALSRVALNRSTDPAVRSFAERMVSEHSDANADLTRLCTGKRVTLPLQPTRADRAERDRLDTLAAEAFDHAYAARMIADHERAVALFRIQRDTGRDPDLTAFATRMTPMLEDHLAAARTLTPPHKPHKSRRKNRHHG